MTLPYDTARCAGRARFKDGGLVLFDECAHCLRRTSPGHDQWQTYIAPHDGEGPCPSRIGARDVPETDFGNMGVGE